MDPRLQQAAESGSIDELYDLIDENPYILENIDAVPFSTQKGISPLQLAVNMDQDDFVCRMIWLDGGLARVKGRNSITPFHLLALKGNADLVARSLRKSPECIQDESVDRQNALHLAVMHDRFDVLQVLTGWIQRMSQRDADSIESRVLNNVDIERYIDYNMIARHVFLFFFYI
ncbi:unnamed protein product [Brassica rapa subsp. narinosa]